MNIVSLFNKTYFTTMFGVVCEGAGLTLISTGFECRKRNRKSQKFISVKKGRKSTRPDNFLWSFSPSTDSRRAVVSTVNGKNMCAKYWLTAYRTKSAQ